MKPVLTLILLAGALMFGLPGRVAAEPPAYVYASAVPPTSCKASSPKTWAVVVGVNLYRDERVPDLSGAVNDAWVFFHYLSSPTGGDVPAERMRLLLNDEATRNAVVGALGNFLGQACPQDQIIIYFAGHGFPEPDQPDNAFLLVHDTEVDNMVATAISMNKLPDFLEWRAGQAGRLLLLIDACHSGTIQLPGGRGAGFSERIQGVTKAIGTTVDKAAAQRSWGALVAATADQQALERVENPNCKLGGRPYSGGLFTCHLLNGLSGVADTDGDGVVVLEELQLYLKDAIYRDSEGKQQPQASGNLEADLVLSHPSRLDVAIPQVPERYLEVPEGAPWPWLVTGGVLAAAAVITGGVFHSRSLDTAETSKGYIGEEKTALERESLDQYTVALIGYGVGGAFAMGTLAAWLYVALDEPAGREDVYELAPWFEFGPAGGAGAGVRLDLPF